MAGSPREPEQRFTGHGRRRVDTTVTTALQWRRSYNTRRRPLGIEERARVVGRAGGPGRPELAGQRARSLSRGRPRPAPSVRRFSAILFLENLSRRGQPCTRRRQMSAAGMLPRHRRSRCEKTRSPDSVFVRPARRLDHTVDRDMFNDPDLSHVVSFSPAAQARAVQRTAFRRCHMAWAQVCCSARTCCRLSAVLIVQEVTANRA